jgi:hypothetical protein
MVEIFHSETQNVSKQFGSDVFDDVLSEPIRPVHKVKLGQGFKKQYSAHHGDVKQQTVFVFWGYIFINGLLE